jgi:hypothetical protein
MRAHLDRGTEKGLQSRGMPKDRNSTHRLDVAYRLEDTNG